MAAHAVLSLNPWTHASSRQRTLKALFGCGALLVATIGVLGLLDGSWPRKMLESWINIHALFGLLLCGLVIARYQWHLGHSPCMLPTEIRELSRDLSRIVYLLLYVVMGIRQSIGIINSIWHGGAVEFNLFDDRLRNGPDRASWNPRDDFQLFLATGIFVLIVVRVFAFRLWLRTAERAALSK
jgi:cytochrome b561